MRGSHSNRVTLRRNKCKLNAGAGWLSSVLKLQTAKIGKMYRLNGKWPELHSVDKASRILSDRRRISWFHHMFMFHLQNLKSVTPVRKSANIWIRAETSRFTTDLAPYMSFTSACWRETAPDSKLSFNYRRSICSKRKHGHPYYCHPSPHLRIPRLFPKTSHNQLLCQKAQSTDGYGSMVYD